MANTANPPNPASWRGRDAVNALERRGEDAKYIGWIGTRDTSDRHVSPIVRASLGPTTALLKGREDAQAGGGGELGGELGHSQDAPPPRPTTSPSGSCTPSRGKLESLSCLDTLFPSYLVSPHSLAFLDTSRPRRCVSFCTYTNRYVGLSARGSKSRCLHSPCLSLSRAPSHSELFTLNLAANQQRAGFLLEFVS